MRNLPTNLSKLRQLINRSSKNLRLLKKKTPLKRRLFRAPAESAKFAQQFVQYDPSRRRDIERTFLTQHGDAHGYRPWPAAQVSVQLPRFRKQHRLGTRVANQTGPPPAHSSQSPPAQIQVAADASPFRQHPSHAPTRLFLRRLTRFSRSLSWVDQRLCRPDRVSPSQLHRPRERMPRRCTCCARRRATRRREVAALRILLRVKRAREPFVPRMTAARSRRRAINFACSSWVSEQNSACAGFALRSDIESRRACKPNSVLSCEMDGHSSGPSITAGLKRPTRKFGAPSQHASWFPTNFSPIWSCSVWGLPCGAYHYASGALLPHLFTLTHLATGGIFSVALSVERP